METESSLLNTFASTLKKSTALLTKDRKCDYLNWNHFGLTPAVSLPRIAPALSWLMFSWSQTGHVLMSLSRMLIPGSWRQFRRAAAWQRCVSFPSLVPPTGLKHSKGVPGKQNCKWKTGGVRTVSANREANTGVLRHQECSLRGIKPQAHCYDSRLAGWFVLSSVGFSSPINIAEVQVPTDTGKGCTGVASTTEGWACLSPGCHPPAEGSGRCFMTSKVAMQQRSPCSVMADWC